MRILHAFSNWKWTGPAEPAVRLAAALQGDCEVDFACGQCPHPDLENLVAKAARGAGLSLIEGLRLRKHFDPLNGARDYKRLRALMGERAYTLVHAHLLNDHLLLGAAARRRRGGPLVVRTVYGGPDLAPRLRSKLAFTRLADGVICASDSAAAEVRARSRLPDERVITIPGAVDAERFSPRRLAPSRTAARAELGLADGDVAFGIVARVQRHRRFKLLFESFARALQTAPNARLVVIGRGTHFDEIATKPVAKLGIDDRVRFPGYREGEGYTALLSALDVGLFLVPGSDGSCRAARELMAAGLPMIVTPRPPLPEIVGGPASGIVVEETIDSLAGAITRLASDGSLRTEMSRSAHRRASEQFSLAVQSRAVLDFYRRIVELGPWRTGGS